MEQIYDMIIIGGVQGGSVSRGAAADDDHIINLFHSHALTAPAFP